jgi:hypothetical protein
MNPVLEQIRQLWGPQVPRALYGVTSTKFYLTISDNTPIYRFLSDDGGIYVIVGSKCSINPGGFYQFTDPDALHIITCSRNKHGYTRDDAFAIGKLSSLFFSNIVQAATPKKKRGPKTTVVQKTFANIIANVQNAWGPSGQGPQFFFGIFQGTNLLTVYDKNGIFRFMGPDRKIYQTADVRPNPAGYYDIYANRLDLAPPLAETQAYDSFAEATLASIFYT